MKRNLKILIDDGMQIKVGTGIGKYSEYIIKYLKQSGESLSVQPVKYNISSNKRSIERIKYLLYLNSRKFQKECEKYDVVHFTNYAVPFKKSKKTKYVVTIHDLAAFLHPETLPKAYAIYNRFIIRNAMRVADQIITVSESVKKEICKKWPKYADKVNVVYIGAFTEYAKTESDEIVSYENKQLTLIEPYKFFLFVGTVESRKNIGIIIDSFLDLKKRGKLKNLKLILAGRPGFGYDKFTEKINKSEYKNSIITTGYLSSSDVKKLYGEALAYIFPSVYEGFGNPQIECMINHVPLICSDIPTNREVSKDYGLFFSLSSKKELEKQMLKMEKGNYDYKKRMKIADIVSSKFNWNKLIYDYISVYKKE